MITILSGLFIKNRDQFGDSDVRRAYGMLCSIVGIALNVFLFAGKYLAGVISGSIAITADAFNNLSDAGSSFISLVGFKFSGMKADADHPFGHGRIEYVSGFGVSMVIILMGIELFKTSIEKIFHPEPVETGALAVGILVVSICVKGYMCFYNRAVGKKIQSETMKATAMDSMSDSIATTAVLISMAVAHVTGISHPEILGIHDLVVHDYGPGRRMISLHGEVSGDCDIFEIHDVIDRIEKELKEKLGCEAVIHMDPIVVNNEAINETKKEVVDMINEHFPGVTIHDFRMIQGPTHTNLIFDAVVPFQYGKTNEEVKQGIEKLISEKWDDYYAVIQAEQSYLE